MPIKKRDEAVAGTFIGGAAENRVVGHQRIAGEIHLRDRTRGECRAENGKVNVRGAPGVVMVLPWIRPGLDGDEAIATFGVSDGVAAAGEVGIERRVVLIDGVRVTAGGIGLPDFNERVRERPAVFIDDPTRDDDAFADGFGVMLLGEIEGFYVDEVVAEDRAGDFGECVG